MTAQEKFEDMVRVIPHIPTTPQVALSMLEGIYIYQTTRILEPQAGEGAIVNAIREHCNITYPCIDMCELDDTRRQFLMKTHCTMPNTRLVARDFLELMPSTCGMYDLILMNPPFSHRYEELDHIIHAFALLDKHGVLVSVVPREYSECTTDNAIAFNNVLASNAHRYIDLPKGSFMPFSNTPSKLIKIWKTK